MLKEGKRNACANLCSKIRRVPRMDTTGIGGGRSQTKNKKQLPNHGVILVFRYNHSKADECNAAAPHSAWASTLFGSWGIFFRFCFRFLENINQISDLSLTFFQSIWDFSQTWENSNICISRISHEAWNLHNLRGKVTSIEVFNKI